MQLTRFLLVVLSLGIGASCSDAEPPLTPLLEPLPAITSLETVVVKGSAELAANIAIKGGGATATGVADATTGLFELEVPLALGENALQVSAIDATGNASPPATATILREPARAESVRLVLETNIVDADQGTLAVQVNVGNDEPAVDLASLAVTIFVKDYAKDAIATVAVVLDNDGHGRAIITGLDLIGAGTVVARADIAAQDEAAAEARSGFLVLAGEPTSVTLELSALVDATPVGPASSIQVPPGTVVDAAVVVIDGLGNVVRGEPLTLEVQDAQLDGRAHVIGSQIFDAQTAGTYIVIARLGEGLLAAAATLTVLPGSPARIELSLLPELAAAGEDVVVQARVLDAFDNPVPGALVDIASDVPAQDLLGAPQVLIVTPVAGGTEGSINVRTAGSFVFAASTPDIASANATLVVAAGPVASGISSLQPTPLVAGEIARVVASFADAFANEVTASFTAVTDAPGAIILADRILGVTQANDGAAPYNVLVTPVGGGVVVQADLAVIAAAPVNLALETSAQQVIAGEQVTVAAFLEDRFGNVVRSGAPVLTATAAEGFAAPPLTIDGVTTGVIAATTAGSFTIIASDPAGLPDASVPLVVNHAAVSNVSFFDIDPAGLPYLAGDAVFFTYSFQDAFGNLFFDAPLSVTANAPNLSVVIDGAGGGEIDGIVRAGDYIVRARALGTGLTDNTEALTIGPNPQAAGFNLQLSAGLVSEDGTALFTATDGFGNAIATSDVTLSITGPAQPTVTDNRIVFPAPGIYAITACLLASSTTCDTEFISVQGIIDTVPPTVSVTITFPNPATSQTVPPRGLVTFRIATTDDRGLAEVRFVASFSANVGSSAFCTTQSGAVLLPSGSTNDSRTFSFNLPACAVPLDRVNIVAQAVDQAGNSANSPEHSPLSVASPFTITATGFVASVAAFENLLSQPNDVVADAATGELFVSSFNRDRIVVVAPDRTQADLRDINGTRLNPVEPLGLARDSSGNLFMHTADAGNGAAGVERLRANFIDDAPFIDSGIVVASFPSTGAGMAIDQTANKASLLCSALTGAGRVQCFTNFSAEAAIPTMPINLLIAGTNPVALAFDPPSGADTGDRLWVALNSTRQIRQFIFNAARTTLTLVSNIDLTASVTANQMGDLVMAPNTGNFIVTKKNTGEVLRVTQAGVVSVIASGFVDPQGLAFDGASLLVVDAGLDSVIRLTPDVTAPGTF